MSTASALTLSALLVAAPVTHTPTSAAAPGDVSWSTTQPVSIKEFQTSYRLLLEDACKNWKALNWPMRKQKDQKDFWRNDGVDNWTGKWFYGAKSFNGVKHNKKLLLEGWKGTMHEYDVKVYDKVTKFRGSERIVRATSPQQTLLWFTTDHYTNFQLLSDCGTPASR
ncbi:ribonuclease domain-containing protein [Streptomyces sp. NPDC048680]|uniref:ribonuclease domain-containing protein n=1 Tax=Streptomyces sp. NPDC048680 TaxID=3155492 RepID=UPI00342EB776